MPAQPPDVLKSYFQTGDRPTEQQFADLIDSLGIGGGYWLSALQYGVAGDSTGVAGVGTDDTAAMAAFMTACAEAKAIAVIPPRIYRLTAAVNVPPGVRGIIAPGATFYIDANNQTTGGMILATPVNSAVNLADQQRFYILPNLRRGLKSNWSDESCVGLRITGARQCNIFVGLIENFTIGLQLAAVTDQISENNIHLTLIYNNKVAIDLQGAAFAPNANRFYGGHLNVDSTTNVSQTSYGVRFSTVGSGYANHNGNSFFGPEFQMGHSSRTGGAEGIPILTTTGANRNGFYAIRGENTSSNFVQNTANAFDNIAEIQYSNNGYNDVIQNTSTATRGWGVLYNLSFGSIATRALRTVAAHERLRSACYYQDRKANTVGIDQMCIVDATPSGTITTIQSAAIEGATLPLGTDHVGLLTGVGIGFAVDTLRCKTFFIDWTNHSTTTVTGRPFVMCFDAAGNVITDSGGRVVFGGSQAITYNSTAFFWTVSSDVTDVGNTRRFGFQLGSNVARIIVGVYQSSASAVLVTAIRLFTDAPHAPEVLFGSETFPWGYRRYPFTIPFTPTAVSAASEVQASATVTAAREGDIIHGAHTESIGNCRLFSRLIGSQAVRFTLTGASAGAVTVSAGNIVGWVEKAQA